MTSTTLKHFLRSAASAATRISPNSITLCLGNEAADADSIISSLCLAYFRAQGQSTVSYVPLVSVSRSELALRRETELLLKEVDLDLSDLICLDEFVGSEGFTRESVRNLILVDHNSLSSKVASQLGIPADTAVDEILDHHLDARKYLHVAPTKRQIAFDNEKNVATAGSTCTLVAELYLASPPINPPSFLDPCISTLLLGVISLDTHNGDPLVGKACPRDLQAMAALQPISGRDRDTLFKELSSAKMDPAFWRGLSLEHCLVLDYKQQPIPTLCHGPDVGVSSILLPLGEMLAKPKVGEVLDLYMQQLNLDMLGVMSFVSDPTPAREIMFVTRSAQRIEQVKALWGTNMLDTSTITPLVLSSLSIDPTIIDSVRTAGLHVQCYSQGNIKASRKQVLPMVTKFYEHIVDELAAEGVGCDRSI